MSDTNAIDAVVIGAGIAGTSVAYFMSSHAKVLVLERESNAGLHSTGRSAALFSESYGGTQVRALTRASRAFFERPPHGFVQHALLSPRGALVIGTGNKLRRSKQPARDIRAFTPQLRLLDEEQMQSWYRCSSHRSRGSGFSSPARQDIDVNALHQGFIRGLKQRGSRLECGVQIHSIERSRGEWVLDVAMRGAQPHTLRAPLVIDAAGAWATKSPRWRAWRHWASNPDAARHSCSSRPRATLRRTGHS
jgi:D-arginine dehydrogenase